MRSSLNREKERNFHLLNLPSSTLGLTSAPKHLLDQPSSYSESKVCSICWITLGSFEL